MALSIMHNIEWIEIMLLYSTTLDAILTHFW